MSRRMRQINTNNPPYISIITDFSHPQNSQDQVILYKHHDTYEPQIPPHISIICVATSHFYLISGILYLFCKQPLIILIGCNLLVLYITSILHWKYPMFDSWIHYIDFIFVVGNVTYATYVVYTLSNLVFTIWVVNISTAFSIFLINETLYYYQVKNPKNILRNDPEYKIPESTTQIQLNPIQKYFSLQPTWPNTPQREYAYYRSTITHGLLVHGLSGGVAGISIAIILLFFYP
jgi:hypothetical protein